MSVHQRCTKRMRYLLNNEQPYEQKKLNIMIQKSQNRPAYCAVYDDENEVTGLSDGEKPVTKSTGLGFERLMELMRVNQNEDCEKECALPQCRSLMKC